VFVLWGIGKAATHGWKKSRPGRTRGQWGEPYGVTVHKKRGVLIIHSFIQAAIQPVHGQGRAIDWGFWLHHMVQDYDNALKLAAGPGQRDVVYQAMGADAAAAGDWKAAGEPTLCPDTTW
jgi:hypothetical protein